MTSVLSGVHEYSHSWYCFYHAHAHPLIYVQGFIRLQSTPPSPALPLTHQLTSLRTYVP